MLWAMEYRMTAPLRWRDLDYLGHVNQSVYHVLLEEDPQPDAERSSVPAPSTAGSSSRAWSSTTATRCA